MSRPEKSWLEFVMFFWSKVSSQMDSSICWEWLGQLDTKGYGTVWRDGRKHRVHRTSFEFSNGPISHGIMICHHCDNKKCVNPHHLFAGTAKDNMQDWTKKGKNRLVNDPSLRKYGDDHWTRSKTKKAKVELKKISNSRKQEWSSGKRVAIRDSKGRIMGTRMVVNG